jgi:hypothetical protein
MHRDKIAPGDWAGQSRTLRSKQFVTELLEKGYSRDDAIAAVCQVFGVPYRAARLFVCTHPVWAAKEAGEGSDRPRSRSTPVRGTSTTQGRSIEPEGGGHHEPR